MALFSPLLFILFNIIVIERGRHLQGIKEREMRRKNPMGITALISKLDLFV
jgi:hypothetical protein